MKCVKSLALALVALCFLIGTPKMQARVSVAIGIGAEPVDCPYGYYPVAPYNCAPYGYYGPEYFNGGVFIGAGPWFHGPGHFRGHVDNRLDWHHYHGALPARGEHRDESRHIEHDFHGRNVRAEKGHR